MKLSGNINFMFAFLFLSSYIYAQQSLDIKTSYYDEVSAYNEKNDVIEEYRGDQENSQKQLFPIGQVKKLPKDYVQFKKVYEYDYDKEGNWIKKYKIHKNQKLLIMSRVIDYL